ncbi:hypothetical protein GCM10011583_68770 [Streptomyces camponoticapitis]|uniref:ARB-07466-like C-terminal domain-containing protein n=1 Tax=Streptomyces camponoticapitis TaxID=1616125 RepID=A0ABQ2EYJ8_9ACTN|nr:hypothetical protein GCM10011583_68770 [Streptomyces camponoticapitis]
MSGGGGRGRANGSWPTGGAGTVGGVSETAPSPRRGRLLRIAAGFAVLVALAGYLVVRHISGDGGPPRCTARATDSSDGDVPTYEMSPEQAANAATISAVGTTRGMPERAVTIALATALQESALRNIDHGDRDSVGLFQQRPSKGWGTVEQILDPVYSAGKFYAGLAEVPGYSRLPLTEAAQRVQRSGFPQAYAKHEPDATLLSAALTGRAAATLTCTGGSDGEPGDPAKVRAALTRAFGPEVLPKADAADAASTSAEGGEAPGRADGQAGGERAEQTDVKSPAEVAVPVGGSDEARGWELAHWAVAHSADLRITEVSVGDRVWSVERSDQGWRKTDGASGPEKSGGNDVRMRIAQ